MRAIVDTNVLIAALLWHGPPHRLLESARGGGLSLVSSPALLAELHEVLGRPKFDAILTRANVTRDGSLADLRRLVEVIDPPSLVEPVCRDPDDDKLLALAIAAKVDVIVSGDNDLLTLGRFRDTPILTPSQALHIVEGRGRDADRPSE